jgi:hypothetical protein
MKVSVNDRHALGISASAVAVTGQECTGTMLRSDN